MVHPRPKLPRLMTLCALALLAATPPESRAQSPQPPARPAKPTAAPATARPAPVVSAPQKPNAQRPTAPQTPVAGQPGRPGAAALPAPPVPPAEIPQVPPPQTETTPEQQAKGSSTGHPLPRYAALRSDEVNFRVGPGMRYPIEWTYKRKNLPVMIEREFEVWRLVRDPEGTRGWVHVATLTTKRSFMVSGAERTLRRSASEDANPVARLQPGVIGTIRTCKLNAEWCQLQVGDHRGWLKRSEFWGTLPNEAVN